MKITIRVLMAAVLAAASLGAQAQDSILAPTDQPMGALPEPMEADGAPTPEIGEGSPPSEMDSVMPEPIPMGEEGAVISEEMSVDPQCDVAYGMSSALLESSGSWLNRGYWYGQADYVLFNRKWDKHGLLLMFERTPGIFPNPNTAPANGGINAGAIIVLNELRVEGGKPSGEGMARVTMGRFLFRDDDNRDHLTELTFLGGGTFAQRGALAAATTAGLQTFDNISTVGTGFDGARNSTMYYEDQLKSLEWNYIVRSRMRKDQMMLQPNGEWVRAAAPTRTLGFLSGARLIGLNERLDWLASDINVGTTAAPNLQDGEQHVRTTNTLLAMQIGGSTSYETARWSASASTKAGPAWNSVGLDSNFSTPTTTARTTGTGNVDTNALSFIIESELLAKWHLRPNLSLRAGFEMFYVTGVALAPHQLGFAPGPKETVAISGDSMFAGSVIGLEWYR